MNSGNLICTRHEEILNICREQLEALPPEPEAPEEYAGVYQALRDIMKETEAARQAGESMENRLFRYSTAIKSLGFARVRQPEMKGGTE